MPDTRFPLPNEDTRFSSPGVDARFPLPDEDTRFLSPGVDTRFLTYAPEGLLADLFAGGAPGFAMLVHPAYCFQDEAGTIPAAVGDPVGRILTPWGTVVYASQGVADKRPQLQQDTKGFYHLRFNGSGQVLQTPAIDFSSTDKMTVFAAVRKTTNTISVVAELTTSAPANAGGVYLAAHDGSGKEWSSLGRGDAGINVNQIAFDGTLAPDLAVLAGTHDISGDMSTLMRNKVSGTSAAGDKGAGNFANAAVYIGARGGSSSFSFTGDIYALGMLGTMTTLAEQRALSDALNDLCGAYE